MLSRFYSWLTGFASCDTATRKPPTVPATVVHLLTTQQRQPRPLPPPRKRRRVTPSNYRTSQSCISVINGYTSSRTQLSSAERLDKFRSIQDFVNLVDLEALPPFRDHSFVSGLPLTTPFFRAILGQPTGPRQLPPHRWAVDSLPVNNTVFVPPAAPLPSLDDAQLAFTPSKRWAWGARQSIYGSLPIDYVSGSRSTTFKYGVLEDYPLVYMNTTFSDTIEFLKEITLHRERLCPLQGSVVMHPINATKNGDRLSINFEPPHHSFWISASPSMPESLKVLVKCAYAKLHQEGVVHGNINLHKILITPNLDVFLQDFRHTSNVLIKINGTSNSMKALPEQMIAEKALVAELLQCDLVDEPIFTVMPGQSREDLRREVQEFLFKVDALEQDMFRDTHVPEKYRDLLATFEAALSLRRPPSTFPIDETPGSACSRKANCGASEINRNGKRRASSSDDSVGFPSKRHRNCDENTRDQDCGSSQTLHSDVEGDLSPKVKRRKLRI